MKNILIVGGTGFLGYHTSKAFSKKFKILSISTSKPKKIRFLKNVKYLIADISKKKSLKKIDKYLNNISYIINFGGHVDHHNKRKVYESHYIGLKNLINYFVKKKIIMFIQIGSSMEYGKQKSPQKENYSSRPISHYGKAKKKASLYALKMFKRFNFPVTILRPYQVYGPNQDDNRLIPYTIIQSLKKNQFPCSSGLQSRDFLYVSDFINCIKLLIKNNIANGQVFNIGCGKSHQVKKAIVKINKKIRSGKPIFNKLKMRKEEQKFIYPDVSKIKKVLKWKPKTNFEVGIDKTIKFYKRNII